MDTSVPWIPICISLVALGVSGYTLWNQRKFYYLHASISFTDRSYELNKLDIQCPSMPTRYLREYIQKGRIFF